MTHIRSERQARFASLVKAFERQFGYSRARVAVLLDVSDSFVSQVMGGKNHPGKRLLKTLEEEFSRLAAGGAPSPSTKSTADVYQKLSYLETNDQPRFQVAKTVIALQHEQSVAESSSASAAPGTQDISLGIAQHSVQELHRKRKDQPPSAPGHAPAPAAPPAKDPSPASAKRGPKKSSGSLV